MSPQRSESHFLRPYSSLNLALKTCGAQRATVEAWLRWWHEITSTPYSVSDPAVAEKKLTWWAKAVTLSFEIPPQHPTLKRIAPGAGVLTTPPIDLWLSQIHALSRLCQQTRWLDEAGLAAHIHASTGAACQSIAWLMGARDEHTLLAAQDIGQALARAHILARLGQDAQRGWLHIPVDWLQKYGVKAHELLRPAPAPHPAHVQQLLQAWQADAKQRLLLSAEKARTLPRQERRHLKPLYVLIRLHLQLLDDLHTQHYPMLHQRLTVGPWRKLWISRKASWLWF